MKCHFGFCMFDLHGLVQGSSSFSGVLNKTEDEGDHTKAMVPGPGGSWSPYGAAVWTRDSR